MALTPEQIQEMRAKYGIPPEGYGKEDKAAARIAEMEQWMEEHPPEKGFMQTIAQPFLQAGVTGAKALGGVAGLGAMGVGKLVGSKGLETGGRILAEQAADISPVDFGPLGKVNPIGISETGKRLSTLETAKQAAGVGAEIGSYLVGGAGAKPAVGALKGITGATAGKMIERGAIEGGLLGGIGMAGAEAGKGGKTLGKIGKAGAIGAAAGAGLGVAAPVLSISGKKAIGAIKGLPEAEKVLQNALEAITPSTRDLSPSQYSELLRAGRITPKTATQPSQYVISKTEENLAKKWAPVLQSKDPVKNINNVLMEISNKDKAVGDFLAKDTRIYKMDDLKNALSQKLSSISDVMIPDEQLDKARSKLLNTLVDNLPQNNSSRTYEELWKFRKELDRKLEKELNAFSGSPTLKKEMSRSLRNGIQEFIAKNTDDNFYASSMKDMSELFDLGDLLEITAQKEKGKSGISAWIRRNPKKAKALGYIGVGYLGKEFLTE